MVRELLEYQNSNGHGVTVFHAPSEGLQHAHITYKFNPKKSPTKNDKADIKKAMKTIFAEVAVPDG